MKDIKKT